MTPEIKREIDALRLSNQLDPKKFLRGGAKRDKVGEFFQVGFLVLLSHSLSELVESPFSFASEGGKCCQYGRGAALVSHT